MHDVVQLVHVVLVFQMMSRMDLVLMKMFLIKVKVFFGKIKS